MMTPPADLSEQQLARAAARRAACTVRHPRVSRSGPRTVPAILIGVDLWDGKGRGTRRGTAYVEYVTTGRRARVGYGDLRGVEIDR